MNLGLDGRTAIVCASSKGLGRACASELARNGVRVFINGRSEETLRAAAQSIQKESGSEVVPVVADINSRQGRGILLEACPEPDILVNNNGGPPFRDFRALDEAAIHEGLAMNMVTPIAMVQNVLEGMVERKFGRIVNVTSAAVKMPVLGLELSSGARAGLTAFMAGVAREVARHNVTINALLPGMFATDRLKELHRATARKKGIPTDEYEAQMIAKVPAKRFGDPRELGKVCAFLCSASSGYITGQSILIDGGWFNATF